MLNPELAGVRIRGRECQRVAFGMGEECRIEICAKVMLFAELHPRRKMLRLQLVAVYPLVGRKNSIAGMKIELFCAGAELQHFLDIRHQLLRRAGAAGITAGRLNAAGQGLHGVGVKTAHVIALPAVQRNRHGFQLIQRRFGIHAERCVFFFCFRIAHLSASI